MASTLSLQIRTLDHPNRSTVLSFKRLKALPSQHTQSVITSGSLKIMPPKYQQGHLENVLNCKSLESLCLTLYLIQRFLNKQVVVIEICNSLKESLKVYNIPQKYKYTKIESMGPLFSEIYHVF